MTLASSGASHVTYSQQGVMRECAFLEGFGHNLASFQYFSMNISSL